MAEEQVIHVYGILPLPDEVRKKRTWHKTTWIEAEVPKKLEKKLYKMINEEVKRFKKECKCGGCKPRKNG